ncbi:MAG: helix-turn-helix transcriptional regulator [Saprospiraceae bacterium]|nr:helix-turn-helix transcriptional regulator [Saprospiraceae bacterium]
MLRGLFYSYLQRMEKSKDKISIIELEGFSLIYSKTSHLDALPFEIHRQDQCIRLHFGMWGDYKFEHFQLEKTFDLVGGHHNLMYSDGFSMKVSPKTPVIETYGVHFEKDYFLDLTKDAKGSLLRFRKSILENNPCIISQDWPGINGPLHRALIQAIHKPASGFTNQLFLKGKMLEIFSMVLDDYSNLEKGESVLKTMKDREKIIQARNLLIQNFQEPPSIAGLSRTVAVNEFKLKKGFKEVFGKSIIAYLNDYKMELAIQKVEHTEESLAAIADELGFSSPQHFSAAFKKQYGIAPSFVRKTSEGVSSISN